MLHVLVSSDPSCLPILRGPSAGRAVVCRRVGGTRSHRSGSPPRARSHSRSASPVKKLFVLAQPLLLGVT